MLRRKPKEVRISKDMEISEDTWINESLRKIKKRRTGKMESRTGSSLIMVVCVSAFLVAFALAMVYTGSMLMARANRRLEQERCYQLASSFAQVLDGELARYSGQNLTTLSDTNYNNSFYRFSCKFLEDSRYQEYNPERPELTTFYYRHNTDAGDDKYGKVTIILYKENDQDTDVMAGTLDPAAPGAGGAGDEANPIKKIMENISRFTLHVEVVAELDGMTYSYSTSYDTQVEYVKEAVVFTVGDDRIFWDEEENKWLDQTNTEYVVQPGAVINYEITPSFEKLSKCTFTKTILEGENTENGGGGGVSP